MTRTVFIVYAAGVVMGVCLVMLLSSWRAPMPVRGALVAAGLVIIAFAEIERRRWRS